MFSGIVEARARLIQCTPRDKVVEIQLERPPAFNDLQIGDSISVDGVCLTVDTLAADRMAFVLAAETLQVTGWNPQSLAEREMNLERSLRWGDRVHGHWVTGHVDALGTVVEIHRAGENLALQIGFPEELKRYVWRKGSIAINGVSLTINNVDEKSFSVGLIPETLRRTNLSQLQPGAKVNLEIDNMARGLVHNLRLGKESGSFVE